MIDRYLLWEAWPDGYLPLAGATTVGGWTCVAARNGAQVARWLHPGGVEAFGDGPCALVHSDAPNWPQWLHAECGNIGDRIVDAGSLLPNVDPTDTATWACLLRDLAEAVNARMKMDGRFRDCAPLQLESGLTLHLMEPYYKLSDGMTWWQWQAQREHPETEWVQRGDRYLGYPPWVDDPAEALVRLRIYEREWVEKNG